MLSKIEIAKYVAHASREMAMSGDYKDCLAVELALRRNGFPEARLLLAPSGIRIEIDRLCRERMQNKGSAAVVKGEAGRPRYKPSR